MSYRRSKARQPQAALVIYSLAKGLRFSNLNNLGRFVISISNRKDNLRGRSNTYHVGRETRCDEKSSSVEALKIEIDKFGEKKDKFGEKKKQNTRVIDEKERRMERERRQAQPNANFV